MERERSIFRSEAVEHYVRVNEETVFPRFVSPRTAVYGWLAFALSSGALALVWHLSPVASALAGK